MINKKQQSVANSSHPKTKMTCVTHLWPSAELLANLQGNTGANSVSFRVGKITALQILDAVLKLKWKWIK